MSVSISRAITSVIRQSRWHILSWNQADAIVTYLPCMDQRKVLDFSLLEDFNRVGSVEILLVDTFLGDTVCKPSVQTERKIRAEPITNRRLWIGLSFGIVHNDEYLVGSRFIV